MPYVPPEVPEDVESPRAGKWLPFDSERVKTGRYDPGLEQVHVVFKDGTPWVYDGVPRNVWRNFRRSESPGRYINRVLNGYAYWRGEFPAPGGTDYQGESEQ
jgi:hypothetical protein